MSPPGVSSTHDTLHGQFVSVVSTYWTSSSKTPDENRDAPQGVQLGGESTILILHLRRQVGKRSVDGGTSLISTLKTVDLLCILFILPLFFCKEPHRERLLPLAAASCSLPGIKLLTSWKSE